MRECTVIIPTWNMGQYLPALFASIADSTFANEVEEIIFVCEVSHDGSEAIIADLARRQEGRLPRVRMIQPKERKGLFVARYLGAQAATTRTIMYIDSRVTLPERTVRAMPELLKKYRAMNSIVDIDINKNIFCLYWERSHAAIFHRNRVTEGQTLTVDASNFDKIRIGGTSFYCPREPFVRLSEKYLGKPLFSDDTFLMADMVKEQAFTIHPDYRIQWEPRSSAKSFLKHLYQRGPGFAEYHIFRHRGWLFYAVATGCLFILAELVMLFLFPLLAIGILAAGLATLALSTALIVKGPREFFRLAPLHVGVILYYGFGALRGIWVVARKNRRAPTPQLTHENNSAA